MTLPIGPHLIPGAPPYLGGRRSPLAFSWRASDLSIQSLTGHVGTVDRGDARTFRDARGRIGYQANHTPVFEYHDLDGDGIFETPALRICSSRTNLLLRSQEFDNASHTKTRSSITANAFLAPDGTLTADKLVEDSSVTNTHFTGQVVTVTAGDRIAYSIFVRAGERSSVRLMLSNGGDNALADFNVSTLATPFTSASGTGSIVEAFYEPFVDLFGVRWVRCVLVAVASTSATSITCACFLSNGSSTSYTGDGASGLFIWGGQVEVTTNSVGPYIPTAGSTVTSTRDNVSFPFNRLPGPLTFYAKFIEIGTRIESTAAPRVIEIGDGTTRTLMTQSANSTCQHDNGPTNVSSSLAFGSAPAMAQGDVVELLGTVSPSGATQISRRVNGGAVGSAAASAANSFAAAYGAAVLYLGGEAGGAVANLALLQAKMAGSVQTMDEMAEAL